MDIGVWIIFFGSPDYSIAIEMKTRKRGPFEAPRKSGMLLSPN